MVGRGRGGAVNGGKGLAESDEKDGPNAKKVLSSPSRSGKKAAPTGRKTGGATPGEKDESPRNSP